jgi:hypothetical protein
MQLRRRLKQTKSLNERLLDEAQIHANNRLIGTFALMRI